MYMQVSRYPKKTVELTPARKSRSQRIYVKSMSAGGGGQQQSTLRGGGKARVPTQRFPAESGGKRECDVGTGNYRWERHRKSSN